jgi:hypothetical protein
VTDSLYIIENTNGNHTLFEIDFTFTKIAKLKLSPVVTEWKEKEHEKEDEPPKKEEKEETKPKKGKLLAWWKSLIQ